MIRLFLILLVSIELLGVVTYDSKTSNFEVQYIMDYNNSLDLNNIENAHFNKISNSKVTFGYPNHNIWIKFDIVNKSNNEMLYVYFNSNINNKTIFHYKEDTNWISNTFGWENIYNDNSISDKNPVLQLPVKKEEKKTLYVMISSDYSTVGEFTIYDNKELISIDKSIHVSIIFFVMGALIVAALFNLFLFVSVKDVVYWYYVGYLLTFCAYLFISDGIIFDLGLTKYQDLNRSLIPLTIYFLTMFTMKLLDIDIHFKKLSIAMKISASLFVLFGILVYIKPNFWFYIMNEFASPAFVLVMIASIMAMKRGVNKAKLYVTVMSFHLAFLGIMSAVYAGHIENNPIFLHGFIAVAFFETIIFTLILGNRINEETRLKLIANESLRKKDALIHQQNKRASMGEMIENIAHQWRQPLAQINSYVWLIDKNLKNQASKRDLYKQLDSIEDITDYMSKTIDSFRNFYDYNKEKDEFTPSTTIEKALSLIRNTIDKSGITMNLGTIKEAKVFGNEDELKQVLLIVLNNAMDAHKYNHTKNPYISILVSENAHTIVIKDNAGGIKKEIIDNIFDPYFTTKHTAQGTGLGLYMANSIIVDSFGGSISVINNGEGATFTIILSPE